MGQNGLSLQGSKWKPCCRAFYQLGPHYSVWSWPTGLKSCNGFNQVGPTGLTCHLRPLTILPMMPFLLHVRNLFHFYSSLLKVIAAILASDPTKYSDAVLGKPNEEYCAWILDSEKWGGCLDILLYIFI